MQAPALQMELHAVGGPHNPVVGSHCSTELPEHVVWSGAHSPVQLPAPRHVVLPHEVRVPHVPAALHSCVLLPTHWLVPGVHATQEGGEPFRQAGVGAEHVAPVCQVPLALHVWMLLPRHSVCPGAHWPWHDPAMHVWLEHGVEPVQVPFVLQVCGALVVLH